MKPTKSFVYTLAIVAVAGAAVILTAPSAEAAPTQQTIPLSTRLTPVMIDYFGLDVAFERPSIAALVACGAQPACATSDSLTVRFRGASGQVLPAYDDAPTTTIEQVRRRTSTPGDGLTETRTMVREFATDDQGRVVMQGRDSIVTVDAGAAGRTPSTVIRLRRYADVRYLMNDPAFVYPITGLVLLELSHRAGSAPATPARLTGHAAVSFDGTAYAQILTAGALTHRANLQARVLETTMPER